MLRAPLLVELRNVDGKIAPMGPSAFAPTSFDLARIIHRCGFVIAKNELTVELPDGHRPPNHFQLTRNHLANLEHLEPEARRAPRPPDNHFKPFDRNDVAFLKRLDIYRPSFGHLKTFGETISNRPYFGRQSPQPISAATSRICPSSDRFR